MSAIRFHSLKRIRGGALLERCRQAADKRVDNRERTGVPMSLRGKLQPFSGLYSYGRVDREHRHPRVCPKNPEPRPIWRRGVTELPSFSSCEHLLKCALTRIATSAEKK